MSVTQLMVEVGVSIQEYGFIMGMAWLLLALVVVGVVILVIVAIIDAIEQVISNMEDIKYQKQNETRY
jgi:flagellar biosynthesis protein FlhB